MIVLECNNDELIIKSLGFSRRQISHQRCKGEVVKKVGKLAVAVGIIDEDFNLNRPREMDSYIEVGKKYPGRKIRLFQKRGDKGKKLIQISPRIEDWILYRAKRNRLDPKKFNLPDDPHKLHVIPNLDRHRGFKEFFKKLIDVDEEIKSLRKWVKETLE
ncbi:MAG: hypothetical protein KAW12_19135 [Candidatus Aminicenantes bacterium]|nr:hypothetical protein [Candidatus Aminicenantes bacterium]